MSHLSLSLIDPLTTALLKITVTDSAGVAVTGATVTADVLDPEATVVANDVALTESAGGVYTLTILPAYSDDGNGVPVLGVFTALVKIVKSGQQRTKQFRYVIGYTED